MTTILFQSLLHVFRLFVRLRDLKYGDIPERNRPAAKLSPGKEWCYNNNIGDNNSDYKNIYFYVIHDYVYHNHRSFD